MKEIEVICFDDDYVEKEIERACCEEKASDEVSHAMRKQGLRLRNFCFTINNPSYSFDHYRNNLQKHGLLYVVMQREVGKSGTNHYQGYAEMRDKVSFDNVKRALDNAHIEVRRGTQKQAIEYCKKQETRKADTQPYEWGLPKEQGKRHDVESFRDAIVEGATNYTLMMEYAREVAKFPKFITFVRHCNKPSIRTDLKVELHWGEPGTGKTRQAYERFPNLYALPINNTGTTWYDGYDGEEVILIDDFCGEMSLTQLLRLLDIYPIRIPIKGSFCWLQAKIIILTSNKPVEEWYDFSERETQLRALKRRIHATKNYRNHDFNQ